MAGELATMALGGVGAYFTAKWAKKELAKTLANSVSDVLEVDPKDIASQLVTYGKVELNNIRLKPQSLMDGKATLDGEIEKISFSWSWGLHTALIDDLSLETSGAKLRIIVHDEPDSSTRNDKPEEKKVEKEPEDKEGKKENDNKDEPGGTVQQILDELSMSLQEFELRIETKGARPLVLEIEGLELASAGRIKTDEKSTDKDKDKPLLQQYCLQMLKVYVGGSDEHDFNIPVLEPVNYTANIAKHGKRFDVSEKSGLEIAGVLPENSNGIVVHTGQVQMETLLALQKALSTSGSKDESSATATTTTKEEKEARLDLLVVFPIPPIKINLPNGSCLETHSWKFLYIGKESVCQLDGKGAEILLNDDRFKLLQLDAQSSLLVNLTGKMMALQMAHKTQKVARLHWHESATKPFLQGLSLLSDVLVQTQLEDSNTDSTAVEKKKVVDDGAKNEHPTPSSSKPWSLNVDGMISFRFEASQAEGEPHQWMEAKIDSPSCVMAKQSDEVMHKVGMEGAKIGPTSFGDIKIGIGPVFIETNDVKQSVVDTIAPFFQRIFSK